MTKRLMDATGSPQRITGPAELLQAVPYLLGFHPERSVVLVGLHDGILMVTARVDLVADADAGSALLAGALSSMCDGGTTELIAVVYAGGEPGVAAGSGRDLPWTPLVDRLDALVDTMPCRLRDVLLVVGQRWWSYGCESDDCCPADGRPLPPAPSAFAAGATVAGVVPLPDRAALEALLDPLPEPERRSLSPLLARAERDAVTATLATGAERQERSVKRALFAAARASERARWQPPADAEIARFAVALTMTSLRDAVWLAIDGRRLDGRPLWGELARRVPAPYAAPSLFLYGWASWRDGNGALAGIAADRAVADDPDYSAADLLRAALSRGVDPRSFPRLSRSA